jgi:signal transduction histidine kinase/ActR/RegA family two-component response regulator
MLGTGYWDSTLNDNKRTNFTGSVKRLFLALICSIYVGELLVMLFIDALPPLSRWSTALLDSTLLLIPVFPILYFFVFRPMMIHLTERRRAEEALQIEKDNLKAILASSPVGMLLLDEETMIADANTVLARIVLRKPGDIIHHSVGEGLGCVHSLENGKGCGHTPACTECHLRKALRQTLASGNSIHGLELQPTLVINGREHRPWLRVSAEPVLLNGRKHVVVAVDDITERKQAEEERLQFERQIQQTQKLESLGVLSGGIAHDFNNILMAVLGNAELALNEISPNSAARENITQITSAAHRAAELCREMMAYSGKATFVKEPVDLRGLIEEMVHLLKTLVSKKAIMNLNFASDLPSIKGDPSQLRQIVMNLIINASEAIGDQNGVITIATGVQHCNEDYLRSTELGANLTPDSYVYVEVTDTGCGMDAQTQAHIFEPFFTTKFAGRGLGLSAVLGIVKTHSGALKLTSEPGRGTTFRVFFPAAEIRVNRAQAKEPSSPAALAGKGGILLADDEEMLRTLGGKMLERIGFTVLTAADGREAVDLYRQRGGEIDLVILDMTMPNMDGAEAFDEISRLNPDVRVIIASGHTAREVTACFEGKSPVGFLQKPFTFGKLKELLATVMTRRGDHTEAPKDLEIIPTEASTRS